MAFTASEQELYDFMRESLPKFLFQDSTRAEEEFGAFVKIFDAARVQIDAYFDQTLILQATGAGPDFLNQHARDRGTGRQDSESDADLRARLRNVEDALTRPLLIQQAQAIIDAVPIVGTVAMVEIQRDAAFFGDFTSDAGTGGTFADEGGGNFSFTPTVPFLRPLTVDYTGSGAWGTPQLVISGASSAGNDGTFPVTALSGDAVVFANGSGVAEADATVSWTVEKRDAENHVIDGFARSFFSRGYRFSGVGLILILPYGCTAATEAAIVEMLRQKKGAGILAVVECRANP